MTLSVKQYTGDIWNLHDHGWFIVIPTNLYVKVGGEAVMGRGLALQACQRFDRLALWYGFHLKEHVRKTPEAKNPRLEDINPTNLLSVHVEHRLILLPVKTSWNQGARKTLIQQSLECLTSLLTNPNWIERGRKVAIPRLGTGNGLLDWEADVKPLMRDFLLSLPEEVRATVCIVHPTPDFIEAPPDWR